MSEFTDYYAILGVPVDASPDAIKAAFKKLALQYHPDVYKGEDAHERMRVLLLAYQTLNDPAARKKYNALRSEHLDTGRKSYTASIEHSSMPRKTRQSARTEVTPEARRDRQRHYAFPVFQAGQPASVDLIDYVYSLSPSQADILVQQGLLRGAVSSGDRGDGYYCHRCHHRWSSVDGARYRGNARHRPQHPRYCPQCKADDWNEYLLLRCVHCHAVFESEQIRYEIGDYIYGGRRGHGGAALCPPYELFPLCPYCGKAHWCPAEDERVARLRERAARMAKLRMALVGALVVAMVLAGVVALGVLRW